MALQPGNTSFVPGDLLTAQQYNITHNTVNKLAIEDNSRVVYPGSFPPANIASGHWVIAALAGNYSNYPGITSTSVLSPSVLVYDSSINEWDVYPLTGASDSTIGIYNPSVQYKINDIVIYSDLDSVLPEYRHEYIYRCNEIAFPDQSPESNPSKWVRQGLYIDTDAITALITSLDSRLTSAEIELTNKVNTSLLGANNGVATLDSQGKILTSQLPSLLIEAVLTGNITSHTHDIYLTDAPIDNKQYARKDGGWEAVESGHTFEDQSDTVLPTRSIAKAGAGIEFEDDPVGGKTVVKLKGYIQPISFAITDTFTFKPSYNLSITSADISSNITDLRVGKNGVAPATMTFPYTIAAVDVLTFEVSFTDAYDRELSSFITLIGQYL